MVCVWNPRWARYSNIYRVRDAPHAHGSLAPAAVVGQRQRGNLRLCALSRCGYQLRHGEREAPLGAEKAPTLQWPSASIIYR